MLQRPFLGSSMLVITAIFTVADISEPFIQGSWTAQAVTLEPWQWSCVRPKEELHRVSLKNDARQQTKGSHSQQKIESFFQIGFRPASQRQKATKQCTQEGFCPANSGSANEFFGLI